MVSLVEAYEIIREHTVALPPEKLEIIRCYGRILHRDIYSREDSPPAEISTMDGYALDAGSRVKRYRIVGSVTPGKILAKRIRPGECCKICTGGWLPKGTNHVVPWEHSILDGEYVVPIIKQNSHIRFRGEDVRKGKLLLRKGNSLGPLEVAACASQGISELEVYPVSEIAHLVTGSELLDIGNSPSKGRVRDSNTYLIASLVQQYRGKLIYQDRGKDILPQLIKRIESAAAKDPDILLLSGGAGMGEFDYGKKALKELGFKIRFDSVSLKPGKPFVFATKGKLVGIILPGNPLSHFVTFHLLVREVWRQITGSLGETPQLLGDIENRSAIKFTDRDTYHPAIVKVENGKVRFKLLKWHTSGDLAGLLGATALVEVPSQKSAGKAEKFKAFKLPVNI